MIWRMFMSSTLEASVFMGKNYSDNSHSIKHTGENPALKQMFGIYQQLILEQSDEIFGVSQIRCESSPWKQLSLVNDEEVNSPSHAKVHVFSDSELCLGKMNQNPMSNTVGERQLAWLKDSSQCRTLDTIDREPMEFECNIFPRFTPLELVREVQKFMSKMGEPEQFQGRIIFMSLFKDIIWWNKDNEKECIANSTLVSVFARRFPAGRWSFLRLGSETKWYSTDKERPGGKWDRVAELMMIKFRESGHPVFPSHESVVSRNAQKRRRWKIIDTLLCRWWHDWNCFSHNHFCKSAQYPRSSLRFFVRNTVLVKQERWDPRWQDNLTQCSRQQTYWQWHPHFRFRFLHKKIKCRSTKNAWKSFFRNQINW